jgi:polyisoprenoid-binding protein YceI
MKKIFLLTVALLTAMHGYTQLYKSSGGEASFFSKAPLENIAASTKTVNSLLNTQNGKITFIIPITSFKFEKALMQEHFNEKYMESDKFPNATFDGKVNETIDYTKDGTHEVSVTGKLTIHGVEQERTIKGTITVKGGQITINSDFTVAVKDHKITIPQLLFENIAETIAVKVMATYAPYQKK